MLSELYLVVRREEGPAVETAIQTVAGAVYTTMQVLGRGPGGGLQYTRARKQRLPLFGAPKPDGVFLPKLAFYLVIPTDMTDTVLERVGAALRLTGAPGNFAQGLGIVLPCIKEIEIGPPSSSHRTAAKNKPVNETHKALAEALA
jgi:nitrogen regulatory protein PII